MDHEGKIQDGRTCGQDFQLARRGEYKDFTGRRERDVLVLYEARMLQGVADRKQPAVHHLIVFDALVGPVRGVAVFGLVVHSLGPDLHLDVGAFTVADGDVQGFIPVRLGIGEPVSITVHVWRIFFRNKGIYLPA